MTTLVEQENRSSRSAFRAILWAVAAVPTVALGLLVSMAVRVRLSDGEWPVRNQPDPKDLGIHYTVTVVAILVSFVAVVAVPLLALSGSLRQRRSPPLSPLALGLVGFVLLIVVIRGDVGGLGDWIGD